MTPDSTWVAIAAIIAGAAISIVATIAQAIFQPLIQSRSEQARWKREREATTTDSITKATVDLLNALAVAQGGDYQSADITTRGAKQITDETVYSTLLSKSYTWEQIIWPFLNKTKQDQVIALRTRFAHMTFKEMQNISSELAKEILDLSHNTIKPI